MTSILLILCIGGTLIMGFLAIVANKSSSKQIQERITSITKGASGTGTTDIIRKKDLEKSFNQRVLFPLAQKVSDQFQSIIPLSGRSWVSQKLIQAGYTKPHYPRVFLGIQMLATTFLFGSLLAILTLFAPEVPPIFAFLIALFFGAAGYGFPCVWLMQEAKKRQDSIQKSLPDFLDVLVICVEAGLGLDAAIQKITTLGSAKQGDYLRIELLRYLKDVQFGKPRKEAMLAMAQRTGVDDLNTIVSALVQAYEMGSSVAHTLRIQSDMLRVKRLQKAEEKANKIPVKMVMPIYIFLFPAIFVAIFGPIGMVVVEAVMTILSNIK